MQYSPYLEDGKLVVTAPSVHSTVYPFRSGTVKYRPWLLDLGNLATTEKPAFINRIEFSEGVEKILHHFKITFEKLTLANHSVLYHNLSDKLSLDLLSHLTNPVYDDDIYRQIDTMPDPGMFSIKDNSRESRSSTSLIIIGNSFKFNKLAARNRLSPAIISKPSPLRLTRMG